MASEVGRCAGNRAAIEKRCGRSNADNPAGKRRELYSSTVRTQPMRASFCTRETAGGGSYAVTVGEPSNAGDCVRSGE